MIQRPESLAVCSGFWESINNGDICTVFSAEELRQAEVPLLAYYTSLFRTFSRCRRDTRPYVQPWAPGVTVAGEPTEFEDTESSDASVGGTHDDDRSINIESNPTKITEDNTTADRHPDQRHNSVYIEDGDSIEVGSSSAVLAGVTVHFDSLRKHLDTPTKDIEMLEI